MTSEQFIYWLQGFVEISQNKTISENEWVIIKDRLALVFDKKSPDQMPSNSPIMYGPIMKDNTKDWPTPPNKYLFPFNEHVNKITC